MLVPRLWKLRGICLIVGLWRHAGILSQVSLISMCQSVDAACMLRPNSWRDIHVGVHSAHGCYRTSFDCDPRVSTWLLYDANKVDMPELSRLHFIFPLWPCLGQSVFCSFGADIVELVFVLACVRCKFILLVSWMFSMDVQWTPQLWLMSVHMNRVTSVNDNGALKHDGLLHKLTGPFAGCMTHCRVIFSETIH